MNRLSLPLAALAAALLAPAWSLTASAQTPPVAVADQRPLLESPDPRLAANKRLVFDMYRTVLNGGRAGEAHRFVADGYVQHNPNVEGGRKGLEDYIRRTRPERPVPDQIAFPIVTIMAEGDLVLVASVSTEPDPDAPGRTYTTTHFDLFRVADGRIVEHWDNVPKGQVHATRDPNVPAAR